MKRPAKAELFKNAVPVLRLNNNDYLVLSRDRNVIEAMKKAGQINAVFVPRLVDDTHKGIIVDFSDEHDVQTYNAVESASKCVYEVTGDCRVKDGKGYKQLCKNGILLHEAVCILYSMYGNANEEQRKQAEQWCNSSSMKVNINHLNGDFDTRDVDLLEVCEMAENNTHKEKMKKVVYMFAHLKNSDAVKNINIGTLLKYKFVGFSALGIYNGKYFSIERLSKAFDEAIQTGDGTGFLKEALASGIIK